MCLKTCRICISTCKGPCRSVERVGQRGIENPAVLREERRPENTGGRHQDSIPPDRGETHRATPPAPPRWPGKCPVVAPMVEPPPCRAIPATGSSRRCGRGCAASRPPRARYPKPAAVNRDWPRRPPRVAVARVCRGHSATRSIRACRAGLSSAETVPIFFRDGRPDDVAGDGDGTPSTPSGGTRSRRGKRVTTRPRGGRASG